MGTRIVKAVGYGITGMTVDPDNHLVTDDPRLNLESPVFTGEWDAEFSDAAYVRRLAEKTNEILETLDIENPNFDLTFNKFLVEDSAGKKDIETLFSVFEGVIYNGEYGDAGTILFIPPGMSSEWHRYDDAIDSFEASLGKANSYVQSPEIKLIPFPPYPFGGWMDSVTGEKLGDKNDLLIRQMDILDRASNSSTVTDKDRIGIDLVRDKVAQKEGYADYKDFTERVVPLVPLGVRDLAEWTGVLAGENDWVHLRPMIYTYWG